MVTASLGPTPVTVMRRSKRRFSRAVEEAIEREQVFAHLGVDVKGDLGSLGGQRAEGGDADDDVVADSAGLDDRLAGLFREEASAEVGDHCCTGLQGTRISGTVVIQERSSTAPVEDLKFVAGIGGKESGDVAEAFGQGGRGEERVFALAQIGVVEVEGEREHVDGDGVGEGGFKKAGLGLFVDTARFMRLTSRIARGPLAGALGRRALPPGFDR